MLYWIFQKEKEEWVGEDNIGKAKNKGIVNIKQDNPYGS